MPDLKGTTLYILFVQIIFDLRPLYDQDRHLDNIA